MTDQIPASEGAGTARRVSSFVTLLDDLLHEPAIDSGLADNLRAVRESLRDDTADAPFLSVLLRTQGKRIEPLRDALLCLTAQTDEDFEVILIDHGAEPGDAEQVRSAVEELPAGVRSRVRVIEVQGGSRATPLNVAVRAAKGRYIAVYDDDDVIFGNWVEAFHSGVERSEGRLIRSVVATQRVSPERWTGGRQGFRAQNWPNAEYSITFDQFAHLRSNHSPFMSWAFPRILFSRLGLEFDEKLSVCEDWDMILRGTLLCGVEQVDELTAIYHRWEGGPSSYTIHSSDAWKASEARVIRKLDRTSVILPPGSIERIRELLADENSSEQLRLVLNSRSWKMTRVVRFMRIKTLTAKFHIDRVRRRLGARI